MVFSLNQLTTSLILEYNNADSSGILPAKLLIYYITLRNLNESEKETTQSHRKRLSIALRGRREA